MPKGFGRRVGAEVKNAKLDDDKAREIYNDPRAPRDIADTHGISRTLVSFIKNGRSWKHATATLSKGKQS